jgi:iron complex transport system substrate-binding protein
MIRRAGGDAVWTEDIGSRGWAKVGLEQIAAWDPDYIFVAAYFSPIDRVMEKLRNDPLWASLGAFQESRLMGFPADYFSWDQPDPRWILGYMWLAQSMHPGLFGELNLTVHVVEFYQEMYGLTDRAVKSVILQNIRGDFH